MFQNRFKRENEIQDVLLELFRRGAIRSTGDEPIEILVGYDSVSLSINKERLEQIIQEVVEGSTQITRPVQDARML